MLPEFFLNCLDDDAACRGAAALTPSSEACPCLYVPARSALPALSYQLRARVRNYLKGTYNVSGVSPLMANAMLVIAPNRTPLSRVSLEQWIPLRIGKNAHASKIPCRTREENEQELPPPRERRSGDRDWPFVVMGNENRLLCHLNRGQGSPGQDGPMAPSRHQGDEQGRKGTHCSHTASESKSPN